MARVAVRNIGQPYKNYLINGNFDFVQRIGTTGSLTSTTSGAYGFDRWLNFGTQTGTRTINQQGFAAPIGSAAYMRWTSTAATVAFAQGQVLESSQVNALKGKTVTFSVLLRRNAAWTQDINIAVYKNGTADTFSGGSWTAISTSTIPVASVLLNNIQANWVRFSVTATVPNDGTANGLAVVIFHSGNVGNTAVLEIGQAMLNEGDVALPFSLAGYDYASELESCQRFYEKSYNLESAPGASDSLGAYFTRPISSGTVDRYPLYGIRFRVRKRINASAASQRFYGHRGTYAQNTISRYNSDDNTAVNTSNVNQASESGMSGYLEAGAATLTDTNWGVHWTIDAEIT